jgi:ectoine hydroxylase-related dioxygenase (phytanoyl-CoA dioxygenase family)
VAGSHKWPQVTQEKILDALNPEERNTSWPRYSERILTPLFEKELKDRNAEITTYLPERGDVLLWHSRLLHRGTVANVEGMERRSLIAHYSGINHRSDMPEAIQHGEGYYFPVDAQQGSI